MPRPPNVRVRVDVRGKSRATVANGHPDTTDTSRARACVEIVLPLLPFHPFSLKNPTPSTPLNGVRLSFLNAHAGLSPDTHPDMLTFLMSRHVRAVGATL